MPQCLGSCEASQALAQVYAVAGSRKHPPPSTSLLGGGGPAGIVGKVEEGGWMSENLTRPVVGRPRTFPPWPVHLNGS